MWGAPALAVARCLATGLGVPGQGTVHDIAAQRAATTRCHRATRAMFLKGEGTPQPPVMGNVAPLVERFEAMPPWRRPAPILPYCVFEGDYLLDLCDVYVSSKVVV